MLVVAYPDLLQPAKQLVPTSLVGNGMADVWSGRPEAQPVGQPRRSAQLFVLAAGKR
jgi:hypothetical protein